MNIDLLICAFSDCINSLNSSYLLENASNHTQVLLLDKNADIRKTFYMKQGVFIATDEIIIKKAECEDVIKMTKLRNSSIKTLPSGQPILCSAVKKDTGEVIGYIIIYHHKITSEFILFIEMLSRQVFHNYQVLLLGSKFNIDKNNIDVFADFTERELKILELLCEGKKDKEISESLYVSISCVRKHIENMFVKTNISSRTFLCCLYYNCMIDKIINN